MATVGNLFVNVRGRTSGFVRDLKKAHKSIKKDFYRNESLAMEKYRSAGGRLAEAKDKGMSPAIRSKRLAELSTARARLDIARRRSGRLEERRGLLAQRARGEAARAFLAREAKALIPLVLGVPAAALAVIIKKGTQAFSAASQFAVMGPQGGRFIEAQIGKMMDDMAFAQRGDVSEVMARTAELERQNAFLWREVGLQFQVFLNFLSEQLGLDIASPKIKGDPGFVPGKVEVTQKMIDADLARKAKAAGLNTGFPAYGAGF